MSEVYVQYFAVNTTDMSSFYNGNIFTATVQTEDYKGFFYRKSPEALGRIVSNVLIENSVELSKGRNWVPVDSVVQNMRGNREFPRILNPDEEKRFLKELSKK